MPRITRRPTHAGSWYDDQEATLEGTIARWMDEARAEAAPTAHARAVIAPHAGYRYSGHVMAYAYAHIDPQQVRRVFLLGPSHHHYSKHCLLSPAEAYSTPLGDAELDQQVYSELQATGKFAAMERGVDETEHSMELHLPYIMHVMRGRRFTLVPIMVGALSAISEGAYGRLLARYLDDPANLFVISSDFCHWGSRFNYTLYEQEHGPIHASIERLDRQGMGLIEGGDPAAFEAYLRQTGNTICGRHPIAVLLHALRHCRTQHTIRFTKYAQSHHCLTPRDSSVSYASAVVTAAALGASTANGR